MADAALSVAENIALLRKTCNKPIPPTRNELPQSAPEEGRVLSMRQELDIVSCLSYLASHSDRPERVMALCIEERGKGKGLTVAVATNTGELTYLQEGIQSIAKVLESQACDPEGDYLDTLLHRVLAHGGPRLVRRLGSRSLSGPSTTVRLAKALAWTFKTSPESRQLYEHLNHLCNELLHLSILHQSSSLLASGNPGDSILISILTISTEIWSKYENDLETILAKIPSTELEDNAKESLKNRLSHLGHYIPTTECLLRHARRVRLFQSIEVSPVYMKPIDFTARLKEHMQNQTGVSNGYMEGSAMVRDRKVVSTLDSPQRNKEKDLISLQEQIKNEVSQNETQKWYKVHAEIQLLYHYETKKVAHAPRILKSSKHACFLCDFFIKIHRRFFQGQFYIPTTHGRVYELWMLPEAQGLNSQRGRLLTMADRLIIELEDFRLSIASQKQVKRPDPPESGIFSLASSSTHSSHASGSDSDRTVKNRSMHSVELSTEEKGPNHSRPDMDGCDVRDKTPPRNASSSPSLPASPIDISDDSSTSDRAESSKCPTLLPTDGNLGSEIVFNLRPGVCHEHTFDDSEVLVRFETPKIHLEVSTSQIETHMLQNGAVGRRGKAPNIRIVGSLLTPDAAEQSLEKHQGTVADLARFSGDMRLQDGILFSATGLLIRKGNHVVQLRALYVVAGEE